MTVTVAAVVIGGGVMGTSILYNLVSRGVKSPVLRECDTLGSGSSNAVRMHYSTTVNADLAWKSLRIFQSFDEIVSGAEAEFVETGYMMFAPEESVEGLRHNIALQQAVGICMAELVLDGAARTVDLTPLRMSRFDEGDLNTISYKFRVVAQGARTCKGASSQT